MNGAHPLACNHSTALQMISGGRSDTVRRAVERYQEESVGSVLAFVGWGLA